MQVVVDGYTHSSSITSGDSVPLGRPVILVCRVVGLPYGTPLSYTWTCPNGPCEVEGYYGRKIYNEHILAVNTTSTSDGGTYTCQIIATGGQETSGSFTLGITGMSCTLIYCTVMLYIWLCYFTFRSTYSGGDVVHSYGRLMPHEFPITDLQQISGPDGIGRITCTVSNGIARFAANGGEVESGGVTQIRNGATTTLVVNATNVANFNNRDVYCNSFDNYLYLFLSSNRKCGYV